MRLTVPVLMTLAFSAAAATAADYTDTAQVVSATPIIEKVTEQRQECSDEPQRAARAPQERNVLAPIAGGVAGALLGRQIGHGNGRDVATAVGAVAGTVVGDRVANPDSSDRSVTGAIIGGTAGAVAGNQVGQGRGNAAATAAGAIAGSMIGDRVDNRQKAAAAPPAPRCKTVESMREVVKGYNVVYRYNGRDINTTLPYDPGATVRVGVGVVDSAAADMGAPAQGAAPAAQNGAQTSPAGLTYRY